VTDTNRLISRGPNSTGDPGEPPDGALSNFTAKSKWSQTLAGVSPETSDRPAIITARSGLGSKAGQGRKVIITTRTNRLASRHLIGSNDHASQDLLWPANNN